MSARMVGPAAAVARALVVMKPSRRGARAKNKEAQRRPEARMRQGAPRRVAWQRAGVAGPIARLALIVCQRRITRPFATRVLVAASNAFSLPTVAQALTAPPTSVFITMPAVRRRIVQIAKCVTRQGGVVWSASRILTALPVNAVQRSVGLSARRTMRARRRACSATRHWGTAWNAIRFSSARLG